MATIQCNIVSPEGELFSGEVEMLSAEGGAGEIAITPRHAPMLTNLKPGPVKLTLEGGEEEVFFASGGFCWEGFCFPPFFSSGGFFFIILAPSWRGAPSWSCFVSFLFLGVLLPLPPSLAMEILFSPPGRGRDLIPPSIPGGWDTEPMA